MDLGLKILKKVGFVFGLVLGFFKRVDFDLDLDLKIGLDLDLDLDLNIAGFAHHWYIRYLGDTFIDKAFCHMIIVQEGLLLALCLGKHPPVR